MDKTQFGQAMIDLGFISGGVRLTAKYLLEYVLAMPKFTLLWTILTKN